MSTPTHGAMDSPFPGARSVDEEPIRLPTLPEIEERLGKATAGPWRYCGCHKCAQVWSIPHDVMVATALGAEDEPYTLGEGANHEQRELNAVFIGHAPTDIAWLVAQLTSRNALLDDIAWHAEQVNLAVLDHDANHHAAEIQKLIAKLRGES